MLTKLPEKQGGYRDEIALFVCPVDEETSRVWFRMALTDHDSSDEQIRAFQHTIFTQDQPVLESQRPRRLPLGGGEVHCAADRSSAAYRRFLRDAGITFGVAMSFTAFDKIHRDQLPALLRAPCPRPSCTCTSRARSSPS